MNNSQSNIIYQQMQLIVITNDINSLEEFAAAKTNNPVLRKNKIIEALRRDIPNTKFVEVTEEIDVTWLEQIHDPEYLKFLKESYDSFAVSSDVSWSDAHQGLIPCNFNLRLPCARLEQIPCYKLSGLYGSDTMTPIYANTWHNAAVSANQAYHGANYVNNSSLVYILATSPGHHAKRAEYGGYCFINNVVVAATKLTSLNSKRVGILDVDYHAGNGTDAMVRNSDNDNISTYSIHCDPVYDYPSFEGFADCGNYPVPPHCDWDLYKITLTSVCNSMLFDNIDTLIIAFGGDTFKDDPDAISIGRFNLNLSAYKEMGTIIRSYFPTIPTMITQEGGYNMEHIGDIVSGFITGYLQG